MNALQNISTKIGFFNCDETISAKSLNGDLVTISFNDVSNMTNDELEELLLAIFKTSSTLETNRLTQEVSLKYDGCCLNLAVKLVGGGEIQHEDDFDIDDASEINDALDELVRAEDDMNGMKDSIEDKIDGVLESLCEMPLKGLKAGDCQKTHISNIINDLSNAANSTTVVDFLSNWEEL